MDMSKAIGIFLVFWGHILYAGSGISIFLNKCIYSFHMPMFFILSGYVFKEDGSPFMVFLFKKFKRILLPAILLYVITLPVYFAKIWPVWDSIDLSRLLLIYGIGVYNAPIWFFICIFEICLIAKLLGLPFLKNKSVWIIFILCILAGSAIYAVRWKGCSFLGFNRCVLGLAFFSFGVLLRKLDYEKYKISFGIIAFPIWFIAGVVLNSKVGMSTFKLGYYWLFVLSGIMGSLSFFAFVSFLKDCKVIRQYATWIVFVICSHSVLVTFFVSMMRSFDILHSYISDITGVFFVAISLILYFPVCRFVDSRMPILNGRLK